MGGRSITIRKKVRREPLRRRFRDTPAYYRKQRSDKPFSPIRPVRLADMMSTPMDITGTPDPISAVNAAANAAASAASSNTVKSTISSLTGINSASSTGNLVAGHPVRAKRKITKQKKSKFASRSFAKKVAWDALLPKFSLRMYLPFDGQLVSDKGKQAIHGDTTLTYMFPTRDFLRQMLYKSQADHQPWTRGTALYLAGHWISNPYTNHTTGDNQGPVTDPPNDLFTAAPGTVNIDQQNWNSGIIMQSFTRTYTFMNVGTFPCTFLVYEFVKTSKSEHEVLESPKTLWDADVRSFEPLYDPDIAYTTNNQIAQPRGTIQHDITDPGMRPTKRCLELKEQWRTKNITTYIINPGQTFNHRVYVPGFYCSSKELNKAEFNALVNKTHCVMFIQQGSIAFEGGAGEGDYLGKLGIGGSSLNMRIESEATFVGLPNNKSYTSYECREDNYDLTNQDYSLTKPLSVIPAFTERMLEQHENADEATAQNDGHIV